MPFRSSKQRRFMFAKHPKIAKRWVKKYGGKIVASQKLSGEKSVKKKKIK